MNNDEIVKYIEAIAGLPNQITYPVIQKISNDLKSLLSDVNSQLEKGKKPWKPFSGLGSLNNQREFIKAAAHLYPEKVFELSRLESAQPPDNIHRMQRTDPYWVGDFFSANMIVHALKSCDLDRPDLSVLDVGSSSGSLVRMLAAYDHSWKMYGCDPIDSAIEWADKYLRTGSFKPMSTTPPLPFESNSMDGVTAISVWSHHRADAAEKWIKEVARVLRPGGFFAVTFSTLHHVRWMAKNDKVPAQQTTSMLHGFAESGSYFIPVDYDGEDAQTDVDWGQAAYSRERFFAMMLNDYDVAGYFPGLNQGNQDLAVFTKRH